MNTIKKWILPFSSGTGVNIVVYVIFKPQNPWVFVWIYVASIILTIVLALIDSFTQTKLAKIDADRQIKRDEIHQQGQ